tara:strand:+ start:1148 stop:1339 length:192 start_codon:yes stop_codon:yes gene_type:complete
MDKDVWIMIEERLLEEAREDGMQDHEAEAYVERHIGDEVEEYLADLGDWQHDCAKDRAMEAMG